GPPCMVPTGTCAAIELLFGAISTSSSGPRIATQTFPCAAATTVALGPTTKLCSTTPLGLTRTRPDTPIVTQTDLLAKAMPLAPQPWELKTPRCGWCSGFDQRTSPERGSTAVSEQALSSLATQMRPSPYARASG